MIDIQKLLAECEFHINRGDAISMDPHVLKELTVRLANPNPIGKLKLGGVVLSKCFEFDDNGIEIDVAAVERLQGYLVRSTEPLELPLYTHPPADVLRELVGAARKVVDQRKRVMDKSMYQFNGEMNKLESMLNRIKEHGL